MKEYLLVNIDNNDYAILLSRVREILNEKKPMPVPGSDPRIKGLFLLRGEIIPVISVFKKMHNYGADYGKKQFKMVILKKRDECILDKEELPEGYFEENIAISVDYVGDIIKISNWMESDSDKVPWPLGINYIVHQGKLIHEIDCNQLLKLVFGVLGE